MVSMTRQIDSIDLNEYKKENDFFNKYKRLPRLEGVDGGRESASLLFLLSFSVFVILAIFTGCEVGLGPAIDLIPPKVALTTPKDNDTRPYTFTLSGTASDNKNVSKIEVSFEDAGLEYLWDGGTHWKKRTKNTNGAWQVLEGRKSGIEKNSSGGYTYFMRVDLKEAVDTYTKRTFVAIAQAYDSMGNSGKDSKTEVSFTIDTEDPNVSIYEPNLLIGTNNEASSDIDNYQLEDAGLFNKLLNNDFEIRGHQEGSAVFRELRLEIDNDVKYGTVNSFFEDTRASTSNWDFDSDVSCADIANNDTDDFYYRDRNNSSTKVYYTRTFFVDSDNSGLIYDDNGEVITDLRNWWMRIYKDDLIYGFGGEPNKEARYTEKLNPELESGKHLLRIVTTSVSSSGAWERAVLGYLCWWPESDRPWVTVYSLDGDDSKMDEAKAEVYPGSNISGVAYDDDGVKNVTYKFYRRVDGVYRFEGEAAKGYTAQGDCSPTDIDLTKDDPDYPTNYQFTIPSPAVADFYKVEILVRDKNALESRYEKGATYTSAREGYFRTLDVKAPTIDAHISDSSDNILVGSTVEGGVTKQVAKGITSIGSDGVLRLLGTVSDDGDISCIKIAYIDPNKTGQAASKNLINFMTGSYKGWSLPAIGEVPSESSDEYEGNKIWTIPVTEMSIISGADDTDAGGKGKTYSFKKDLRLVEDMGITKGKKLSTQQFVLMACDMSATTSVPKVLSITGDKGAPTIKFKSFLANEELVDYDVKDETHKFSDVFSYAKIKGSWGDDSSFINPLWSGNKNVADQITVSWRCGKKTIAPGDISMTVDVANKTWEAEVKGIAAEQMGTVTVTVTDFAGNIATTTKSYYVSTGGLSWLSISTLDMDIISGSETYNEMSDGVFTTGDVINLTTVFSPNAKVKFSGGGGDPTLKLNIKNSSGVLQSATYISGSDGNKKADGSMSGTVAGGDYFHVYTYTVKAGDYIDNDGKLSAEIVTNGNTWRDTSLGSATNVISMTAPKTSLNTVHDITIDTKSPKIKAVAAINDKGAYNAGKSILVKVTMTEPVSCTDENELTMTLEGDSGTTFTSSSAYTSGQNDIIFIYEVQSGENASPLKAKSFSLGTSVISDLAGNELETDSGVVSIPSKMEELSGIIVDTTPPDIPVLRIYSSKTGVDYEHKVSGGIDTYNIYDSYGQFSITGEEGAIIYYKMRPATVTSDPASERYSGKSITLSSNGGYEICAMQEDAAGNQGAWGPWIGAVIDKGALLTKVTSTTPNGTYKVGTEINIRLIFRKVVTISSGDLKLNITNKGVNKRATHTTTGSSATHDFLYTVEEGDEIISSGGALGDGLLDILDLGFSTVMDGDKTIAVSLEDANGSSSFLGSKDAPNKEIKINTGCPTIKKESFSGDIYKITYDRAISKNDGNITFTLSERDYRAPIVLTETAYNTLLSKAPGVSSYYERGTNGAILNNDNTLTNDTSTKYILKYQYDEKESTLCNMLVAAGLNKVIVPIYSNNVSASGEDLLLTLSGAYALPTKGASYAVSIDAGVVKDSSVGNLSKKPDDKNIISAGLEAPVIRLQKSQRGRSETIKGSASSTTQAGDAKFKINSRNPSATLKYSIRGKKSDLSVYTGGPTNYERFAQEIKPTGGPKVDTSAKNTYNGEVTLNSSKATESGTDGNLKTDGMIVLHSKGYNRVYYWGGDVKPTGGDNGEVKWPGMNMAKEGDMASYNEWSTITLMGTKTSLKFNYQNNQNNQSPDLKITSAGEYWYNGGSGFKTYNPDGDNPVKKENYSQEALKFAICAVATSGSKTSDPAYEYACKSVLYLEITPSYGSTNQGWQSGHDYNDIWLRGGDSKESENTISAFPLSWNTKDYNGVHLMTRVNYPNGQGKRNDGYINGRWYYTTWDLTSAAYLGFFIGDIPSDAQQNGPKKWAAVKGAFCAYTNQFRLFPGEKLLAKSCFASRFSGSKSYASNYDDGAHDVSQGCFQQGSKGSR